MPYNVLMMMHEANGNKIKAAASYDYPASGHYASTMATLEDGREMMINTQHSVISPRAAHGEGCRIEKMGGRCDCGLLDDISVPELVAHAREHGLSGSRPEPDPKPKPGIPEWKSARGLTLTEEMDREDTIY